MPNWCNNDALLIAPTKEQIDNLVASLETSNNERFFNALRPRPEDCNDHWYEWNTSKWGTKWDTDPQEATRIDDVTLYLVFDTAWGPPLELYNYLFEQGWDVTAKYHEPGVGFVGEYDNSINDTWEYSYDDESTIDDIPEELLEWAGIREDFAMWKSDNDESNYGV
jgi:hypothetical protein